MQTTRKLLLASAAVMALGLGFSSSAQAFDTTNWQWDVNVEKNILENVTIDTQLDVTGLATIESLQINAGNVTSVASIQDFENNPPGVTEGETVFVDETVTVTSNFNKPVGVGNSQGDSGGLTNTEAGSQITATYIEGTLSEQNAGFTVINDINISGEFEIDSIEGVNDAVDLPKVENIATAVGNNFTADGTVATNLNAAQINYGGYNVPDLGGSSDLELAALALGEVYDATGNEHVNVTYVAALSGALGLITQGEVSAEATISNDVNEFSVENASVVNAATAVGNNLSTAIEANTSGDAFLVADVTQFNYANTSATASVDNVAVNNYGGLGAAGFGNLADVQTPILSNVATAVGNNVALTVNSPTNNVVVDTP